MKKTYSLGMQRPDYSTAVPSEPATDKKTPMKEVFPSFYLSDLKNPIDLPDEGTAEIKYKVVSRTESTRDGETKCSYDIEIQELTPTSKTATASDDDEIESGLQEAEADKAGTEDEAAEE